MTDPETTAVDLADLHADEAVKELNQGVTVEARAVVHALLALDAGVDALREMLSRGLTDLREAVENINGQ